MKTNTEGFLDFFDRNKQQLKDPLWQRPFAWGVKEFRDFWDDIYKLGVKNCSSGKNDEHWMGLVLIQDTDRYSPSIIGDGQQRAVTGSLLIAAFIEALIDTVNNDKEFCERNKILEPIEIREKYLINKLGSGDAFYRLLLTDINSDKEIYKKIINNSLSGSEKGPLIEGLNFFRKQLKQKNHSLLTLWNGLEHTTISVGIIEASDNAQQIFESINSTGKPLSQTDLIRNFLLMDLNPAQQEELYKGLWMPLQEIFAGNNEQFDAFMRHFLMKEMPGKEIREKEIYREFKDFKRNSLLSNGDVLKIMLRDGKYYSAIKFGTEPNSELRKMFSLLNNLEVNVANPLLLKLYNCYVKGTLNKEDFLSCLENIESYMLRRACVKGNMHTNTTKTTFSNKKHLGVIDENNPCGDLKEKFKLLSGQRRFPTDDEFIEAFKIINIYEGLKKRKEYILERLENIARPEGVVLGKPGRWSIEHIMPQEIKSSEEWQKMLGPEWQRVHSELLHTIGNLTIVDQNSKLSNKSWSEKRDNKDFGFCRNTCHLAAELKDIEKWDEDAMKNRAEKITIEALKIWKYINY